jgi:hypothetical protein
MPHRLVTEPWYLESGELPAYVRRYSSGAPLIADDRVFDTQPCNFEDLLDAAIGLFMLPKQCTSGELTGDFGGWHIQRAMDAHMRWWRKVEATSFLDIPVMLIYFVIFFLGLVYLSIGLAGLVLTRQSHKT